MSTGPLKDANKKQLKSVFQTFSVPDFVKSASMDEYTETTVEKCAGLDDYPIGDKASAWVSTAYFLKTDKSAMNEAKKNRIEKNLQKAAEAYGFDYEEMEEEVKAAEYEEAAEVPYALKVEKEGETVELCPIPTEISLNKAADWVYENRDTLPFNYRKTAARNIIDRARELDIDEVSHHDYVEKAAGIGVGDPQEVADAMRSRAALFEDENIINTMNKAADKYDKKDVFNPEEHAKVASLVAAADEASGTQRLYKRSLKTPEELLYKYSVSEIEKSAGELLDLANGITISELQLKRANFNTLAGVLGE